MVFKGLGLEEEKRCQTLQGAISLATEIILVTSPKGRDSLTNRLFNRRAEDLIAVVLFLAAKDKGNSPETFMGRVKHLVDDSSGNRMYINVLLAGLEGVKSGVDPEEGMVCRAMLEGAEVGLDRTKITVYSTAQFLLRYSIKP